ncbi:OmpA family protein [Barnesiella sp. ET7]|uniref:OmpA family protein n=1 Tax=Barnesiella sp. ET7 TaxID=2972460 RepID=UPI0021AC57EF|nr:OmpA family protein [Barnesiella sp. ET7]MCR8910621.1 OmpA family protein [Barnesiella sp. ET7]
MKKTVFAVLLMATGVATPAMLAAAPQEEAKTESSKEIVLNSFKDNWMISLEGGADFSLGRFDSNASFGKRIAPVFGLNVEKWFSPIIGLRLGADYYGIKGAALWGNGLSGEMLDNTYYKQSYGLIVPGLDVMGDLASLFCGYRERVYSPILYVGMSVPVGISGEGDIPSWANMGMRGGLLNRFRLSDAWAINLDLRFDVLETTVSNEGNHGKAFSALVGVTYKFKNRGWKSPEIPVVAPVAGKYSDAEGDALVAQLRDANRKIANLEQQLAECKNRPAEKVVEEPAPVVTVYYNINSSELQSKDRVVLRAVAKAIKANEGKKYVITGYADSETGTAAFNAKLRKARAERVYDALVSYGVNPDQLEQKTSDAKLDRFGSYILDRAATISPAE